MQCSDVILKVAQFSAVLSWMEGDRSKSSERMHKAFWWCKAMGGGVLERNPMLINCDFYSVGQLTLRIVLLDA